VLNGSHALVDPHSECDPGYERLAFEPIARATIVEDTGTFIPLIGCGPGVDILRRIRHRGRSLFILETSYQ
jgi:hypothetical protein